MKLEDAMRALTAGSSSSAGKASAPAGDGQAWRRQMERAQADAWFHGFEGRRTADPPSKAKTPAQAKAPLERETVRMARPDSKRPGSSSAVHVRRSSSASAGGNLQPLVVASPVLPAAYQPATIPVAALPAVVHATSPAAPVLQVQPILQPMRASPPAYATAPQVMVAGDDRPRLALTLVVAPPEAGTAAEIDDTAPPPRNVRHESTRLPVRVHVEGDKEHATVWLGLDTPTAVHLPTVTRAVAQWLAQSGYGPARWICNGQALDLDALPGAGAESDRSSHESVTHFPFIDPAQGESA
ncbi:hypothetical protein [Ideonella sp. YS5]|uniref:hypothetical protein n=1 Tax=Ideonella sp. YS5 TaxID=3453714 RepID=UPI003EEFEDED